LGYFNYGPGKLQFSLPPVENQYIDKLLIINILVPSGNPKGNYCPLGSLNYATGPKGACPRVWSYGSSSKEKKNKII
jgi:hypothetical protein